MDDTFPWLAQDLTLLGPDPASSYRELEGHGVAAREALGVILACPPLRVLTPALAKVRCGPTSGCCPAACTSSD